MKRAAFLLALLGAAALAQFPQHRFFEQPNLWRRVTATAAAASVAYGGPWFAFAASDSGVNGIPLGLTAACACRNVYGVTADGDAGVALSLTRNSTATCNRQGNVEIGLVPGDFILCDGGLPVIAPVSGVLSLLVEEARTNSLQYSGGLNLAPWAKSADVTIAADVAQNLYDVDGGDHVTFTPSATKDSGTDSHIYQQFTATTAVWTGSYYARSWDGGTGCLDLRMCPADAGTCTAPRQCNYGATFGRCSLDAGLTVGPWYAQIGCEDLNNSSCCGAAADVVIVSTQAEAGAYASSPIQTLGGTAARSATQPTFSMATAPVAAQGCIAATVTVPWGTSPNAAVVDLGGATRGFFSVGANVTIGDGTTTIAVAHGAPLTSGVESVKWGLDGGMCVTNAAGTAACAAFDGAFQTGTTVGIGYASGTVQQGGWIGNVSINTTKEGCR